MRFLSERDSDRVSPFPLHHSNRQWASVIQFYENFGNRTEKEKGKAARKERVKF